MAKVFMMTTRMCTIATVCVALLCLLLFLIGVQVGQRLDAWETAVAGRGGVGGVAPMPATVAPPANAQAHGT